MLAKFYHETTIMKVVAKKNNGSKVLFSNAFWSADFVIFFPRLSQIFFHDEILQAATKNFNVCQKKYVFIFFDFTS